MLFDKVDKIVPIAAAEEMRGRCVIEADVPVKAHLARDRIAVGIGHPRNPCGLKGRGGRHRAKVLRKLCLDKKFSV